MAFSPVSAVITLYPFPDNDFFWKWLLKVHPQQGEWFYFFYSFIVLNNNSPEIIPGKV